MSYGITEVTVTVLVVWLTLVFVWSLATARVALAVWRRGKGALLAAEATAALAVASATFGLFSTVIGLRRVFEAAVAESLAPPHQGRALAETISGSVNRTALAFAIWVPSFIAASLMLRSRARRLGGRRPRD